MPYPEVLRLKLAIYQFRESASANENQREPCRFQNVILSTVVAAQSTAGELQDRRLQCTARFIVQAPKCARTAHPTQKP